jgi:hypothetical protein
MSGMLNEEYLLSLADEVGKCAAEYKKLKGKHHYFMHKMHHMKHHKEEMMKKDMTEEMKKEKYEKMKEFHEKLNSATEEYMRLKKKLKVCLVIYKKQGPMEIESL